MPGRFEDEGRPLRERKPRQTRQLNLLDIAPNAGNGNDDIDHLEDAVQRLLGLGGGSLLIPDIMRIGSDWSFPRSVKLVGTNEAVSQIKSHDASPHNVEVTGVPADSPEFDGDAYAIERITFDGTRLRFGPGATDVPRGCKAFACEFVNIDEGLYIEGVNHGAFAQVGAVLCKFRLVDYGIVFHHAGPYHVVQCCDIGECNEASILVDGMQSDGISLFITSGYYDHCRRFLKVVNPVTDGGIYIAGVGVELCGTGNSGAYADGYGIEMDAGQVWIDQMQMFNGPDTDAQFWVKGGVIYDRGGRRYWDANGYARLDGGTVIAYQDAIFSPGKLWGPGQAPFAHASSTAGKVVAPRSGYIARHAVTTGALDATTPKYTQRLAEAWDVNDREITFEFNSFANGTSDNTMRVQLADGVNTIRVDLPFPKLPGRGQVRIIHKPGATWTVAATYNLDDSNADVPTVSNPPTQSEVNAVVARLNAMRKCRFLTTATDPGAIGNTRFLEISTIAASGTVSSMSGQDLREIVSGPVMVGV